MPATPRRDALQRFPDGRLVIWVVEPGPEGTVAAEKLVQIGLAFEGLVEVRSGLEPGARVVIEGNESLQSGQRVLVSGGGT